LPVEFGLTGSDVAALAMMAHCFGMMFDPRPIRRPNPLAPSAMTPAERRAELCALLALGLVRLRQRERGEVSDESGDFRLHYPGTRCRHATIRNRRTA
jgi:hypothetical protein